MVFNSLTKNLKLRMIFIKISFYKYKLLFLTKKIKYLDFNFKNKLIILI